MNRTYSEENGPLRLINNCVIQVNSYQFGVIAKKKEKARILSNSSQVLTLTLSSDSTVSTGYSLPDQHIWTPIRPKYDLSDLLMKICTNSKLAKLVF